MHIESVSIFKEKHFLFTGCTLTRPRQENLRDLSAEQAGDKARATFFRLK